MSQLNTAFKHKSNTPCNNGLFSSRTIAGMNKQMERLYLAAKTLKGVEGQSAVARLLNASPQTINNWEARGVSRAGMLTAQRMIGCSAIWVQTGEGDMAPGEAVGQPDAEQEGRREDLGDDVDLGKRALKLAEAWMNMTDRRLRDQVWDLVFDGQGVAEDRQASLSKSEFDGGRKMLASRYKQRKSQ